MSDPYILAVKIIDFLDQQRQSQAIDPRDPAQLEHVMAEFDREFPDLALDDLLNVMLLLPNLRRVAHH